MRHAAQYPTTLVVLYKSMLQLALDCGAQQKKMYDFEECFNTLRQP